MDFWYLAQLGVCYFINFMHLQLSEEKYLLLKDTPFHFKRYTRILLLQHFIKWHISFHIHSVWCPLFNMYFFQTVKTKKKRKSVCSQLEINNKYIWYGLQICFSFLTVFFALITQSCFYLQVGKLETLSEIWFYLFLSFDYDILHGFHLAESKC